jgi:hypothetical protein
MAACDPVIRNPAAAARPIGLGIAPQTDRSPRRALISLGTWSSALGSETGARPGPQSPWAPERLAPTPADGSPGRERRPRSMA